MSDRFGPFEPDKLPAKAKTVYDRIMRDRGYMPGPYRFWLAAPGYADRVERVEEFLRTDMSLDKRHVELATIMVARHWTAQYVWTSHAPTAVQVGVDEKVVEAIRVGGAPQFDRADDAACYAFSNALLAGHGVDDTVWAQTLEAFGEEGANEIIGLIGLYTSVCMTMVAYRMPTKNGEPDQLP